MTDANPNAGRSIVDRRKLIQEEAIKFEHSQLLTYLPPKVAEQYRMAFLTLLAENPALYNCSTRSLFSALLKAARDGLVCDGRESAIIPFKAEGGKASDSAVYIPMITGIRKKARASGELVDWYSHVVYRGDEFDFQLGDEPYIKHKPKLNGGSEREVVAVYSVAKFKDGTKSFEVMGIDELEEHRDRYSRAKSGPWYEPITRGEMFRKTVMRRHAKALPLSGDVYSVIAADDELVRDQLPRAAEKPAAPRAKPASVKQALDDFAAAPMPEEPLTDSDFLHDPETGEVQQPAQAQPPQAQPTPPKTPEAYFEFAEASINRMIENDPAKGKSAAKGWFDSQEQRAVRKSIGIPVDDTVRFSNRIFGVPK